MPIHDLTYRSFRGGPSRVPRWFPILENTVHLAFRNRFLFWVYVASALPVLFACVYLYIRYQIELRGSGRAMPTAFAFDIDRYFDFLKAQSVVATILAGLVGSSAISQDRRGNAFEALFARSIGRFDYLLGRFLGLLCLVLGSTLVPGFVLWYADNVFSLDPDRLQKTITFPFRIAAWAVVYSTSVSLLVLAFSAAIPRGWIAFGAFLGYGMISSAFVVPIAKVLQRTAGPDVSSWLMGLGYGEALFRVQAEILHVSPRERLPEISLVTACGLMGFLAVLSIWVLFRRVRPIEVVA